MNKWEKKNKFLKDMIDEMVSYGISINPNKESNEYKQALWDWVQLYHESYKKLWEMNNGELEDN